MAFPPAFTEELRSRLVLSEVIAQRIPVTRAGREYKACCPFHNEKTPSFTINDQKGFFHCFGCGAHGDVIGFTMQHDKLSFVEAIEQLAQQAGLDVPRLTREEVSRAKEQKTLHALCEAACQFFQAQLKTARGRPALTYLHQRGLKDGALERFRLGYAPADGSALISHLTAQGFALPQIIEAGLARQREGSRESYSFFRDRVIFPVTDRRGRVVAFGGRILSGDGPKYINSPDHPLFHKGQLLYSLARAREQAARGQPLLVVEGYMDVIALVEAGFEAAVAPLGTALTEEQLEVLFKLERPAGPPIVCFDGDAAGQRAATRAVERVMKLLGPERTIRIAFLPQGQDPDDLIKSSGAAAMQLVLDQAISLDEMIWRLETTGHDLSTPEAKVALSKRLAARVEQIADPQTKLQYQREFKERQFQAFAPKRAGRSLDAGAGGKTGVNSSRSLPAPLQITRQKTIIAGFLFAPSLFARHGEEFVRQNLTGPLDTLWQAVVTTLENSPDLDSAGVRAQLSAQGLAQEVEAVFADKEVSTRYPRTARDNPAKIARVLASILQEQRLQTLTAELEAEVMSERNESRQQRIDALRHEIHLLKQAFLFGDEETA